MPPQQTIVHTGVSSLLDRYAKVSADDRCIIAFTPDSKDAAAWVAAGLAQRGIRPSIVAMRPLVDYEFAGRLKACLPSPETLGGKLVVFTLERDTMSHFGPLADLFRQYHPDACMIVRIIGASAEFFELSLGLGPEELSARNATLLSQLMDCRRLRIQTHAGTDLTVSIDSDRYEWISNRGVWRPGGFTILPPGEVATYPARIDGVLVADGAINCNVITDVDVRLEDSPLTVQIRDGRATDFQCENGRIRDLVSLCFKQRNGRRVGELGFGTNSGITTVDRSELAYQ